MKNTQRVTLDYFGLLKVEGVDSRKFLQGQITCDAQSFNNHSLMHGAHCTAKGRMIANFDAFALNTDTIVLRAPIDVLPGLLASLKKYIVFSKAEIKDVSEEYQLLGIYGDSLENLLAQLELNFSLERSSLMVDELIFHRLDEQRLECWLPVNSPLPGPIEKLSISENCAFWQTRDIEIGKGWVRHETVEEFLPQMLNLQADTINGISFKKGCYTGQEIIARMHYKGKLKRQMFRFKCATLSPLTPGTNLFQAGQPQPIGEVVNSVIKDGSCELLAVTLTDLTENENCTLQTENSEKLERINLPYAITTES